MDEIWKIWKYIIPNSYGRNSKRFNRIYGTLETFVEFKTV